MVAIPPPPPAGPPPRPSYIDLSVGSRLVRVFDPTRFGATPLTLRSVGPINRFDHHRTGPPATPVPGSLGLFHDPDRAITYAASTLSCCLVEIFGQSRTIDLKPWQAAHLHLDRPVRLLDLRGEAAMRAGTVAAICKTPERSLSQDWSRHFYEQQAIYGHIDGLLSLSAYNDEPVFCLYERAVDALRCDAADVLALDDPALRAAIEDAAIRNNLFVP